MTSAAAVIGVSVRARFAQRRFTCTAASDFLFGILVFAGAFDAFCLARTSSHASVTTNNRSSLDRSRVRYPRTRLGEISKDRADQSMLAGVPLGETIGHTARFARIANVVSVPVANPWRT